MLKVAVNVVIAWSFYRPLLEEEMMLLREENWFALARMNEFFTIANIERDGPVFVTRKLHG